MSPDQFPPTYRSRMIQAYPVIAQMTADEAYSADVDERNEAFKRILAAKNLRRTHELFLATEIEEQSA